ncbi:MAG: hypothetical protein SWY16_10000 [Cyanobacteriota bacterium]|nr:hypothetical protein [Cyanobacteriota bacterium]
MLQEFQASLPMGDRAADELLATYQTSHEFYREVEEREAFERYCQWYDRTARMHQDQMKRMQGELNILSWFQRKSR